MIIRRFLFLSILLCLVFGCKSESNSTAPSVSFANLKAGDTVTNPFVVQFSVTGMTVAPAGAAKSDTAGHHHLIIDGKPIPYGQMVPMDKQHLHFMKGETQHTLDLQPGEHTLTLQFAGTDHRSFGPPLSKTIKVKVRGSIPQRRQIRMPACTTQPWEFTWTLRRSKSQCC